MLLHLLLLLLVRGDLTEAEANTGDLRKHRPQVLGQPRARLLRTRA